jgi:hypothetical protein
MNRNVLAEHNGRRRRGGERRDVDPDTLEDEIARLRDLDLPKHRKSLPGVNERPTARSELGQQAGTRPIDPASPAELSQKLAALNDLTAPQLRAEWRRLYRGQPPRLSRDLLVRSIAYRIQELAHGGLSKATRRKLLALTKVLQSNGSIEPDDGPNLRPGARLVREERPSVHMLLNPPVTARAAVVRPSNRAPAKADVM